MDMQNLLPLVNTFILLFIFFYQKNKNKVLVDRITHQEKTLIETKDIILQQSTMIDNQSKIVDTAIRYSESFSVEKLEKIIHKQVSLEQKEQQAIIEEELRGDITAKEKRIQELQQVSIKSLDLAIDVTTSLISPLLESHIKALLFLPKSTKDLLINEIADGPAKEMLVSAITNIEDQIDQMAPTKMISNT
ncbi:hypothetical protein Q4K77_001931 [Vibrio cholerae]|uniref:hypothetical protein n=1 Tax=Vibrio cholerae TaxID=666 RepID=UPI0028F3AC10|nr:hypothetical protein [Vibrio cholerae]